MTPFTNLLHYLHKGHQRYENLDPALSFEHYNKSAIENAIVQLNKRLNQRADKPLPSTSDSPDRDSIDSTWNLSLNENLHMAILIDKKFKYKGRLKWNVFGKLLLENCRIGEWIFGKWQHCHQITIIS